MAGWKARRAFLATLAAAAAGLVLWLAWLPAPGAPRDIAPPRAARPGGVVFLGTSLSHAPGWPEAALDRLAACGTDAGPPARVTRPGANARWGAAQLDTVAALAPAVVVVEFAINDADLTDGLWPADSRAAQRAILQGLRDRLPGVSVVFLTTNPVTGIRRLTRPRLGAYYAATAALAAETGAGLADLYPRWRTALAEGRVRLADGLHPDPGAASAIAAGPVAAALAIAFGGTCPAADGQGPD